jgi:hypothetical protein
MTTVEDMSTTRKAAHYKGSRPRNQEKAHYADLRIMPMWIGNPLQDRGFLLARSA